MCDLQGCGRDGFWVQHGGGWELGVGGNDVGMCVGVSLVPK